MPATRDVALRNASTTERPPLPIEVNGMVGDGTSIETDFPKRP
jgi:hypothetical protein